MPLAYPDLKDKLSPEQAAKRIGGSRFKALNRHGYAHPPTALRAMLSNDPYPVRGLVAIGTNVVTTYPNTPMVVEALKSLDFIAVHDIFMTPTAEIADLVLPAAANLEREEPRLHLHIKGPRATFMDNVSSNLAQVAERKSDWEFIIELGKKLGFEEYFPSLEVLADDVLKPLNVTWEELKSREYIADSFAIPKIRKDRLWDTDREV